MDQEQQSHLEGDAAEQPTVEIPADGVSGDEGSSESSSETVHPAEGQSAGDEEVFHEEGGRKFATKDEFIQFHRQQRGAASRVARDNKILTDRISQLEAARGPQAPGTAPAPQSQEQVEKIDDEVQRAAEVLAKTGKFASPAEVREMQETLKELRAQSDQAKFAQARQTVDSFLDVNPDAAGHEQTLADLIQTYGLDRSGTEEGLRLAFRMHFGRDPKASSSSQLAQQAYKKGQVNAIKKSQAGSAPGGNVSGSPANSKPDLDWSVLD